MPSFDIVSEVDMHEVHNAVDQANREVGTRFDFKGTDAKFELDGEAITMHGNSDFQLKQMKDVLVPKLLKRGVDVGSLESGEVQPSGKGAKQVLKVCQGIESDLAKKIVKTIKEAKMKVQASIQGDKVRVTGKKRDDLQEAIAMLRQAELGLPLQFNNFRD